MDYLGQGHLAPGQSCLCQLKDCTLLSYKVCLFLHHCALFSAPALAVWFPINISFFAHRMVQFGGFAVSSLRPIPVLVLGTTGLCLLIQLVAFSRVGVVRGCHSLLGCGCPCNCAGTTGCHPNILYFMLEVGHLKDFFSFWLWLWILFIFNLKI